MSLEWSEVLERLLRLVESRYANRFERVCVVRDLRGRVRLAVRRRAAADELNPGELEADLHRELGAWFAGPALFTDGPSTEARRLASNLLEMHAKWPHGWPTRYDDGTGKYQPISVSLWCGEERVRAKQSWLAQSTSKPPWPLHPKTPAIVSFYSFKGGVGRTTTLGIVARLMAREGRKVVVVDLDLEAPGVGRFLDVQPDRGVLDLLIEHLATGVIDYADIDRHWQPFSFPEGEIAVFPVGQLGWSYIEKLGRLDFTPHLATDGESPVEAALRAVLGVIRRRHAPDYILLDARAGLHDIGGLSLHSLSHLDVLVGRKSRATLDGFALALEAVYRRRRPEDHRVLVVQTFVPAPLGSEESRGVQAEWRARMWDCLAGLDQLGGGERPSVNDATARHYPWPVPAFDAIARADRIDDIDATTLDAEPFVTIRDRIHERCLRSLSSGDEAEGDDDGREVPE